MFKILYFYIFNRSSINICLKNSIKPYFKFYFGLTLLFQLLKPFSLGVQMLIFLWVILQVGLDIPAIIQTWDELMAIFTNTSSGALNYYWNMGDGGIIITSENVSYTYEIEDSTSYIITLIAETEFGCIDTISRIITTPLVFYIPNAFTPDGN